MSQFLQISTSRALLLLKRSYTYLLQTKLFWSSICIIFVIRLTLLFSSPNHPGLMVAQCKVGQGDAILLKLGEVEVVIDSGPDDSIVHCLQDFDIPEGSLLEFVVATHADADHIGGFQFLLEKYQFGVFLWNGQGKETKIFRDLQHALEMHHVFQKIAAAGQTFSFGDLILTVLWPDPQYFSSRTSHSETDVDTNSHSIVLRAKFGDFRALFSGDLPEEPEKILISSGVLQQVSWLKVAHHGSSSSTSAAWISVLHPAICSIGVGKNSYGHPSPEVVQRLERAGCKTMRTDLTGHIWGRTDGKTLRMFAPW